MAQAPNVSVTKSDGVATGVKLLPGTTVNYTNVITNSGPGAATGVQFVDPDVVNATYVAGSLRTTCVALPDTYACIGNMSISIPAATGVLANDLDPDNVGPALTSVALSDSATTQGGRVTMATDGSFTYTAPAGFRGVDTFTYTLNDGEGNTDPGTVTINITNVVWFVNANSPVNGNGTFASPFNVLSSFTAINNGVTAGDGDRIFLYESGVNYTGGIALRANQRLISQDAPDFALATGLTLPAGTTQVPAMNPTGSFARITNSAAGGHGVTLASGCHVLYVRFNNCPGYCVFGNNATNVTLSNLYVNSTGVNGGGVSLTNTSLLTGNFVVVSTAVGAPSGILLNNVTGDFEATTGSIVNSTGAAISITGGGNSNFTFAGNISKTTTTTPCVSITGKTGGTVNFSGEVRSTVGAGVSLTTNPNTTFNFTGGVRVDSADFTGFLATGGGTVRVTRGPIDSISSLTSTTGTALRLENVTAGNGGLVFTRISAGTTSNSAGTGIYLSNVGNTSGQTLTVDGLGSQGSGSAGSGGTIQFKSGANGSADGCGVYLNNVSGVSLNWMQMNDFQNFAIKGNNVVALTLNRVVINATGAGTNGNNQGEGGVGEGSVRFDNLLGTCSITNSTITHGVYDNVGIFNTTGTPTLILTATGSTFATATAAGVGNDAVRIEASNGNFVQASFNSSCSFTAARGDLLDVISHTGTGVSITVDTCAFSNNHAGIASGGGGLIYHGAGSLDGYVQNSTFRGARGRAINISKAAQSGTFNATVMGNTIGVAGANRSGSLESSGIFVDGGGAGRMTVSIQNNTIQQYNEVGIYILANNQSISGNNGRLNAYVYGNTTTAYSGSDPATLAYAGLFVDIGTGTENDATQAFVDIGGSFPTTRNNFSLGDPFNGNDVFISDLTTAAIRLPGYAGGAEDSGAVIAYLAGRSNNAGATTFLIDQDNAAANGFSNGAEYLRFAPREASAANAALAAAPVANASMANEADSPLAATPAANVTNRVSETPPAPVTKAAGKLGAEELDTLVEAAKAHWRAAGLSAEQLAVLEALQFEVADLEGQYLGAASEGKIHVDSDAGGNGWFIDATPMEHREFNVEGIRLSVRDGETSSAATRVDLLTTLMHEMGHSLGLRDSYRLQDRNSIMYGHLTTGERRLPQQGQAEGAVPLSGQGSHFLSGSLNPFNIGTLPAGKSITITYQVTVNDPIPAGQTQMSSRATVQGTNFSSVQSDDPDEPGTTATITLLERPATQVVSYVRGSSTSPTNATSVTWVVAFDTAINGLTASNFSVINTGLGGSPAITSVTPNSPAPSATWTITASTGTGQGTLGLNVANDTGMSHRITAPVLPLVGDVYSVDRAAPVLVSCVRHLPALVNTGADTVVFRLTFSEAVQNVTADDFTVTGGSTATVMSVSTVNASTYDLTVSGGNLASYNGSLSIGVAAGHNITDLVGNPLPVAVATTHQAYTMDNTVTVALTPTPSTTLGGADGVVTMGEEVSYRLTLTVPDGDTAARVKVNVPLGMAVNVTNAISLISSGMTGVSTALGAVAATVGDGDDIYINVTIPNDVDDNISDNNVVLDFNLLVLDVPSNSGINPQTVLTPTVTHDNGGLDPTANTAASGAYAGLTVVEPVLEIVSSYTSTPTPWDAGGVVRYQIRVQPPATSTSNAYKVSLSETLPAQWGSLTIVSAIVSDGATSTNVAGNVILSGGVLSTTPLNLLLNTNGAQDQVLTVVLQGTLAQSVTPGQVVNHGSTLSYSTYPGNRTAPSYNPNTTITTDRERLKSATDSTRSFTTATASLSPTIFSTSAPTTGGQDVTIGETVTYQAQITMPEGTVPSLVLNAIVPAGMQYVPGSSAILSSSFNGTISPAVFASDNSDGADVTVTFGQIVTTGDNVTTNNTFTVQLSLRVLDVPGNTTGTTLLTQFSYDIPDDGLTAVPLSTPSVIVVEPVLAVAQNIVETSALAGHPVTLNITVQNVVGALASEDTRISVPIAAGFDMASIQLGTAGTQYPAGYTASVAGNTVIYQANPGTTVAGGATQTFAITVNVRADQTPTTVITNAAVTATSTTLPGTVTGERSRNSTSGTDSVTVDAPTISIVASDATADENSGDTATIRISRNTTVNAATVNFQIGGSSTASAADYTLAGGSISSATPAPGVTQTVVIPAGVGFVDVVLTPINDIQAETAETLVFNLMPSAGIYTVGAQNTATATISANDFVVINTNNAGEGTLRQAVLNANAIAGTNTITFEGSVFTDATPDVINLTTGQIEITSALNIEGNGAKLLTVRNDSGTGENNRIFNLNSGSANATIRGLTITGGSVGPGYRGAGVLNNNASSTLRLVDCVVTNNSGSRGAVSSLGNTTLIGCTISQNTALISAQACGGVVVFDGTLNAVNCTISGNQSAVSSNSNSGGFLITGGVASLQNCTITNNDGLGGFGGVNGPGGSLTITQCIISNNLNNATLPDVNGSFTSGGGNIIGNVGTATGFTQLGDVTGTGAAPVNAVLGPLADNGGSTLTHALLAGSPALNRTAAASRPVDTYDADGDGNTTELLPVDQRGVGFDRAVGMVDSGAFEMQKSVSILANAASVAEGSGGGTTPVTFTVSRTGVTTGTVTINYAVTGTGPNPVNAADFGGTLPSGQVTIPDGDISTVLTIPVSRDAMVEPDEELTVTLSSPTNDYILTTATALTSITNDDTTVVTLSGGGTDTESNTTRTLTATLSNPVQGGFSIGYGTAAGTAGVADYTDSSGTLTFAGTAGETKTFNVTIINDSIVEPDETITASLGAITGTALTASITTAGSPQTLTILDNDTVRLTLVPLNADQNEGSGAGTTAFTFQATLSSAIQGGATATYSTADGTAMAGSDYTAASGSLTFTGIQGETATITVLVNRDDINEADETFQILLNSFTTSLPGISPVALTIWGSPATGTIRNDDALTISILATDGSADENAGGTGTWRISRNGVVGNTTVNLAIGAASTATDADWTATGATFTSRAPNGTGTAVIPAGQTYVDVTLTPTQDIHAESAELVILNIAPSAGVYVVGSPANASVTIEANDFVVINTWDTGEGSLRQAALNAASIAGPDTITFGGSVFTDATPDAIILLTQVLLSTEVTIEGPGAKMLTVRNAGSSRVFITGSSTNATIRGLTMADGNIVSAFGGALYVEFGSTMRLINCAVVNCTSQSAAIVSRGNLSMVGCTVSGNTATAAGNPAGLYLQEGTFTAVNCTISGNQCTASSSSNAGGIRVQSGSATLQNCTITNNDGLGGVAGIRVVGLGSTLTINQCVIANNVNNTGYPDLYNGETVISGGGNIIGNVSSVAGFVQPTDLTGTGAAPVNALLGPLADNGGPTQTHMLLDGSPAINIADASTIPVDALDADGDGNTTELLSVDQRGVGFARLIGTRVDAGAFEAFAFTPVVANVTINEDTQSGLLTVLPNAADGSLTTAFKITNIQGGTLYLADGTTPVTSGTFLTLVQGAAGLKFTPSLNLHSTNTPAFGFSAQATVDGADTGLRTSVANLVIAVTPVNDLPTVVPPGIADQRLTMGDSITLPLAGVFADVDGDTLTYTVTINSDNTKATATIAAGSSTLQISGLNYGVTTITVQASDSYPGTPGTVTTSFVVAVGTVNPTPGPIPPPPGPGGYVFNRQTALIDIDIPVTNTTAFPINGFRLTVDYRAYALAHPELQIRLYNRTSAPGVSPDYVDYPFPVAVGQTVSVRLSFFTYTRTLPLPFNPTLSVEALPVSEVAGAESSQGVRATIHLNAGGVVVLSWPSVATKWYRIQYTNDLTNWYYSPVPIQAVANFTQWRDTGAPFTHEAPGASRFYRVMEIPTPTPPPAPPPP